MNKAYNKLQNGADNMPQIIDPNDMMYNFDSASSEDGQKIVNVSEEYEQDLLDRLSDIKRRMENKRVLNHVILPFAIMLMIFVMTMYPNKIVISVVCLFMIPSILFNIVFILSPLYGKVYIVQKVNFFIYKVVMFTIALLYVLNLILVFGNLTLVDFSKDGKNYIASGSMFICHFCL